MPKSLDELLDIGEDLVEVTPPRAKSPIRLRHPSFAEWHALSVAHRQLDGKDPPADLIAKTVAVCIADGNGDRKYRDADLPALLETSPKLLMWVYVKCWETVLRNDEKEVREDEKN